MDSSLSAAQDRVVTIHYTLTLAGGKVVDQSGEEPLSYLHGHENIVPGLERQLEGKTVGATLKAVVAPADGYGEKIANARKSIAKSALPQDEPIEPGMQFAMEDDDGEIGLLWVVEVQSDHVVFDLNHPLAGETLTFDVEVVSVRNATAEELDHGHVHGPHDDHDDGHHHGHGHDHHH